MESTSKQNGIRKVDVAVLGGGPAGTAIALGLTGRGYSTVVIERSDYRDTRIGETLPPAVQPLLASLGIWDRFLAQRHSRAFGIRSAWGQKNAYNNDFIFNPYGAGWHVDRSSFDAMMAGCAEEAGACVYRRARPLTCENDATGNWKIEIMSDDGKRGFHAKFLVDATGRRSYAARKQGAKRLIHDRLIGVYFFFSPRSQESARDGFTLVEAVEDGWWYSAVLPGSRMVLAYMTDVDLYARDRKHSSIHWLRKLQTTTTHTQLRIEPYSLATGPHVFTANSSRLDRVTNGNWLAIGDAALAFDPLSGQGVYKALQSASVAAQSIQEYWTGNNSALRDYDSAMRRDFENYSLMQKQFYAREQRWPKSVFWQRRIES